jgi:gamma-glutamylcyclotransferase
MTFLYFAYGSNMLAARLKARCPSATAIGRAKALGHTVDFSKPGRTDGSGKATLVQTEALGMQAPGVLFEISKADLSALDRAEGAGFGYDRYDEFPIKLDGKWGAEQVVTYIASKRQEHLKPYDWYLALVIAGAHQHQLDAGHRQKLREVEYMIDQQHKRKGRMEAMRALAEHGFSDHTVLLGK